MFLKINLQFLDIQNFLPIFSISISLPLVKLIADHEMAI